LSSVTRIFTRAAAYTWQNLCGLNFTANSCDRSAHEYLSDDALHGEPGVQVGDPDVERFTFPGPLYDHTKAVTILDFKFRDLKTTAKAALKSYRDRGLID
jgi:hypothetical protein